MSVRRSRGRPVDGILLLDKPMGLSSNGTLQIVKRLYQARKAGHTGSLDPLATGLLPLCFGEATKVSAFLLDADKRYDVIVQLGVRTTSGDAEGEVVETRPVSGLELDKINGALARFRGPIQQIPPMHSALKVGGQPLYKLAHRGIAIARPPREVEIFQLDLLSWESDRLHLHVHCSKGTYIRTLAEDIGAVLGTGGHVASLRRTAAGPFDASRMVTLDQLRVMADDLSRLDALLLPMDSALAQWPGILLSEDMAFYLRQGQPIFVPRAPVSGLVRLHTRDNRFVGVGCILEDGRVAPKRLIAA